MEQKFTEEEIERAQMPLALLGLTFAFHDKYGEEALETAGNFFYQMGKNIGEQIKRKLNIQSDDIQAVTQVYKAFVAQLGQTIEFKIEGNIATMLPFEGNCPPMVATKLLDLPWEKACPTYSWKVSEGLVSAVNPKAKAEVPSFRGRGDPCCQHVIRIEE